MTRDEVHISVQPIKGLETTLRGDLEPISERDTGVTIVNNVQVTNGHYDDVQKKLCNQNF